MNESDAKRTGIFDKFAKLGERYARVLELGETPFGIRFDEIMTQTRGRIGDREVILAGTNNYLGLTFDPAVQEAAREAILTHGSATTGSRQANGTYAAHVELEESLRDHFGAAAALVFTTGYQANLGAISALAGPGDHLLIDADSHACIYDACRLSDAATIRFRHNDPANLERRLQRLPDEGARLVVIEGMYSMFGDVAPLAEFLDVAHANGAALFVDEAHSVGCFGPTGRGVAEAQGVLDKVDFISGTFSKSFASIGGFCVSRHREFEAVRLASRAYLFTASGSPSNIAAAQAALGQMKARPELRDNLWARARQLHAGLAAMGYDLCAEASPVVAVRRPDELTAVAEWNALLKAGVYLNLAIPPATPGGVSLLRLSVSAAHSKEDIDAVLAAFASLDSAQMIGPAA